MQKHISQVVERLIYLTYIQRMKGYLKIRRTAF